MTIANGVQAANGAMLEEHRGRIAPGRFQPQRRGSRNLRAPGPERISRVLALCLRKYFGEVRPAAMMISANLLDPRIAHSKSKSTALNKANSCKRESCAA